MKIAAFNVHRFGLSKVSDADVLSTLVKIVSRYDVVLILEVVDVSGASVKLFLEELNTVNTVHHYALQISSRLGRSRYKEQFMFLYRDDVVDLVDCYQYEDDQADDVDAFAREPYILRFKPRNADGQLVYRVGWVVCVAGRGRFTAVLKDVVLIPVHTEPWETERELDELYDVFLAVRDKWKTDNIMILGDFNADGAYITQKKMNNIRIRTDTNFHWLMADGVDTSTKTSNDHTYDRIVVYGDDMLAAIVPNSAKPFNFHKAFGLTEEMALRVSDHFPVEVEILEAPPFWTLANQRGSDDVAETRQVSEESLQVDVLTLQKENLQLEQQKLRLQVSLLQTKLDKLQQNEPLKYK